MSRAATPVDVRSAPVDHPAVGRSDLLHSKLAGVCGRLAIIAQLTGIGWAMAALVLGLAAGMLLDWRFELSWGIRAVLLSIYCGGALAVWVVRGCIPFFTGPNEEDAALMVERHQPAFATRLIAAVQLCRPGAIDPWASPSMVRAMLAETEAIARPVDFKEVVRTDPAIKALAVGVISALLGLSAVVWANSLNADHNLGKVLLRRALLGSDPIPRNTRVVMISGDMILARGDAVEILARFEGLDPGKDAHVKVTYDSGRTQEFSLERHEADRAAPEGDVARQTRYGRQIEAVQESFQYTVYLNDGHGPAQRVEAVPRPTVAGVRCWIGFPSYTGIKDVQERRVGDLSVVAGGSLTVHIQSSKPVSSGSARLVGLDRDVPLVQDKDGWTATFPVVQMAEKPVPADVAADGAAAARGNNPPDGGLADGATNNARGAKWVDSYKRLTGFTLRLVEKRGTFEIESRDDVLYRVEVIPDRDPQVKVMYPESKVTPVTQRGAVLMSLDLADDFAVKKLILHYRVNTAGSIDTSTEGRLRAAGENGQGAAPGATEGKEETIELALPADRQPIRSLTYPYVWDLSRLKSMPAIGSTIVWWIEARDANVNHHTYDDTGRAIATGGVALTDEYTARVVSEAEMRREMDSRVAEYFGRIETNTQSQEDLNDTLGKILTGKKQ